MIANGTVASVYNNTVSRNTTTFAGGTGGFYYAGSAANVYIANNIFWNNTNYGINLGSSLVQLDYNDIGTQGGSTPLSSSGNLSLAPGFVDAAGGDFHLAGNSALLGAVPQAYQSIDPDGNASPVSGKMDMGAYNETVFTDGFDGN